MNVTTPTIIRPVRIWIRRHRIVCGCLAFALILVFMKDTPGRAAEGGIQASPTTALLDSVKPDLPHLDPVKLEIDKDRIAIESEVEPRLVDGRPILFWRPKGQSAWIESKAGVFQELKGPPECRSFAVAFGELRAEVTARSFIGDRVWRFSGRLTNAGKVPVELARFHYFDGTASAAVNFLELMGPREQPRLRSGLAESSPRDDVGKFWGEMGVQWLRLAEPIRDQAGWFVSRDIAALVENWTSPGWGFGFVGPGNAFGEIGYRALPSGPRVCLGVILDNIVLDPGDSLTLEEALVWRGDWQSGLDVWAKTCAAERGVHKPGAPLVGYCSWYQKGDRITADDIDQATREFASWPMPPGGRTIQIDDGFQNGPADWDPNAKFKAAWPGLAQRIAATGSVPGLWVAPTTVDPNSPIVKEHPEWLQRLSNGEPAIRFSNWGGSYYLDPDHPEVRAFIRGVFERYCKEGWRYFKLDFTYPISTARLAWDRKKTEFQTLHDLYALIRETVGPDVQLNACVGGPDRYALGQVNIARLGGDIGFDYHGVRETIRQIFSRAVTNGVWWNGDPDVFAMRSKDISLSGEEKRILTGSIGLFGGLFLTSDFASQWTPDEAAFIRRFWNEQGPRPPQYQRVVWDADGDVVAYRVSYEDDRPAEPKHRIALYNWTDAARDVQLPLADAYLDPATAALRLTKSSVDVGVTLKDGVITVPNQPAHSLRMVDLLE